MSSDHIHQPVREPETILYKCSCGIVNDATNWRVLENVEVEFAQAKTSSYSSILRDCAAIAEEREPQYGEAVQNMKDIARLAEYMFGLELTAEQVCQVFIATKTARDKTKKKDDNVLDAINYNAIMLACRKNAVQFSSWT